MTAPDHSPPLVLVSWDGVCVPLALVELDATPAFDLLLFDYSGRSANGPATHRGLNVHLLSEATECKGDIYNAVARHLSTTTALPEFVGLIDDDVLLSVSGINRLLHVARSLALDVFSPALSHDSVFSHRWMLHRSHVLSHQAPWIEVMMPFYRGELFARAAVDFSGNISSYGIDQFAIPVWQHLTGATNAAVVDAVIASHRRPISSRDRRFRNGLTAMEEYARIRERCAQRLKDERPDLLSADWYRRLFIDKRPLHRWERSSNSLGRRLREWLDRST